MAESLGTFLWELRTASGWTLGRLAQQAGISKAALSRWEAGARQPRVAELVTLRYFGGLTVPEAAAVLGVSARTADAWWAYARAWLAADLDKS